MIETFYEVMRRQRISRRSFLKYCSLTATSLGLGMLDAAAGRDSGAARISVGPGWRPGMSSPRRADQLVFRPGQGLPAIQSTRMPLAGTLLRGRPAHFAPQRLSQLYALCGEAHRLTAQLAIDAAAGGRTEVSRAERFCLQAETAREHVRRIWLDWPRLLAESVQPPSLAAMQASQDCPLFRRDTTLAQAQAMDGGALRAWVERDVLGQAVSGWLTAGQAEPQACLHDWGRQAGPFPAMLLRGVESDAASIQTHGAPLPLHADPQALQAMAQQIAADEDFASRPASQEHLCETGTWTRLNRCNGNDPLDSSVWLRCGARIAELAWLSADTPDLLALGAMPPAANPAEQAQAVRWAAILVAAFDPCVPFNIVF